MKKVYATAFCRTPIGSFGGGLKALSAAMLGACALKECLRRAKLSADFVDQVLLGNVLQGGQGQNPARQAAVFAGLPFTVPAVTVNMVCGSSLRAINLAASIIRAGDAECLVAGGMESMSNAGHFVSDLRWGKKTGDFTMTDGMLKDGLWDVFNDFHMGVTAENIARKYAISREEQDAFALDSQRKASKAQENGAFDEETITVEVPGKKGEPSFVTKDEYIRHDATSDRMAALRPVFVPDGTVTAGNSSGINDGAAAVLVASEDFFAARGLVPQARIAAGASSGVDPAYMGMGPVPAIRAALSKEGISVEDCGLFELNEAFAAQALAVQRELGLPGKLLNVNGGAIALGHPIGASGARIAVTLVHEMRRRSVRFGLAALCVGGGMGEAVIFERDSACE